MILPTKGIGLNEALLAVGGTILQELSQPKTVSRLWNDLNSENHRSQITFDWFVLALDLLYILGAVKHSEGRLSKRASSKEAQP